MGGEDNNLRLPRDGFGRAWEKGPTCGPRSPGGIDHSLGFDPDSFSETIYDVLIRDDFPIGRVIIETKIENLYLAPSNLLIDCPPSLGILTMNALVAAERVIIPVQSEYLALQGLKHLNKIISKVRKKGNPELKAEILRTMHDRRITHTREIEDLPTPPWPRSPF